MDGLSRLALELQDALQAENTPGKLARLRALERRLLEYPVLLEQVLPPMLSSHVPTHRRWILELLHVAIAGTTLDFSTKCSIACNSVQAVTNALHDNDPEVVLHAVRVIAPITALFFEKSVSDASFVPTLHAMLHVRDTLIPLLRQESLHIGIQLALLKYTQTLCLLLSASPVFLDVSIARIQPTHALLNRDALADEGTALLHELLGVVSMPFGTASRITATVHLLTQIAARRPTFLTAIATAMLAWPQSPTIFARFAGQIQPNSVARVLKIAAVVLCRLPMDSDALFTRVVGMAVHLGARPHELPRERRDVGASGSLESSYQHRKAIAKAIQSSLDVTTLPFNVAAEIILQSLMVVSMEDIEYSVARYFADLETQFPQEQYSSRDLEPRGNYSDQRPPPEQRTIDHPVSQQSCWVDPTTTKRNDDSFGIDQQEQNDEEYYSRSDTDDIDSDGDIDLDRNIKQSEDLCIGSKIKDVNNKVDLDGKLAAGIAPDFELLPGEMEDEGKASVQEMLSHGTKLSDTHIMDIFLRLLGGEDYLTDDPQPYQRRPLGQNTRRLKWLAMITRIITRLYDEASLGDQLRQMFADFICAEFKHRYEYAIYWFHQEKQPETVSTWFMMIFERMLDEAQNPVTIGPVQNVSTSIMRFVVETPCVPWHLVLERLEKILIPISPRTKDVSSSGDNNKEEGGEGAVDESGTGSFSGASSVVAAEAACDGVEDAGGNLDLKPPKTSLAVCSVLLLKEIVEYWPRARKAAFQLLARTSQLPRREIRTPAIIALKQCYVECLVLAPQVLEQALEGLRSGVKERLELMFALCMRTPELFEHVFRQYTVASVGEQQALRTNIALVVRAIGMNNALCAAIEKCERGAESLALRILLVLTERQEPSAEWVDMVCRMHAARGLNGKFLLPVLGKLDREKITRHLAQLVSLLSEGDQNKKVWREILVRVCGGEAPRIAPDVFFSDLHALESTVDMRKLLQATQMCVESDEIFGQNDLARSLERLVRLPRLPKSAMRSILLVLRKHPTMVQFGKKLLVKLAQRRVWAGDGDASTVALWEGYLRVLHVTLPHSIAIIFSLPFEQARSALGRVPGLRDQVIDFIESKRLHTQPRVLALLPLLQKDPVLDEHSSDESGDDGRNIKQIRSRSRSKSRNQNQSRSKGTRGT